MSTFVDLNLELVRLLQDIFKYDTVNMHSFKVCSPRVPEIHHLVAAMNP